MSATASSPPVPSYLTSDFDPTKAKVAELRTILLTHSIPYSSNAKKSELVTLFRTRIVPLVPQLLAQLSAVRASDDGVLDGESHDGSLRELDTDPEESASSMLTDHSEATTDTKKRKKTKSKRKSMVGRAQQAQQLTEEREEAREDVSPRKRKKSKTSDDPVEVERDFPVEYDTTEPLRDTESSMVSPKKRKMSDQNAGEGGETTPRSSSILKARRRTIQSEGEAGFSDYNPFQSGGEETPGRDLKKRKSSLGPERLKSRKSTTFDLPDPEQVSPPPLPIPAPSSASTSSQQVSGPLSKSPAKPSASSTRPELTSANSWSSTTASALTPAEEARQRLLNPDGAYKSSPAPSVSTSLNTHSAHVDKKDKKNAASNRRATMGPAIAGSSSRKALQEENETKYSKSLARASLGGGGAFPLIGTKYMAPGEKVRMSSPEARRLMRQYETEAAQEKERQRQEEADEQEKEKIREREAKKVREEAIKKAQAEVERLELARENHRRQLEAEEQSMEVDDLEYEAPEVEVDFLEDGQNVENEDDPFEAHGAEESQEEYEEELFGESAPAPPPVVQALRGTSTPRRSDPLPYSPRQAHLAAQRQASAQANKTPQRRSFPLPTPPTSTSRRSLVPASARPSKEQQVQQQKSKTIALRSASPTSPISSKTAKQISGWTILLLTLVYSLWWREEKLAAGFCDTNMASNEIVSHRSTSLAVPSLPSSLCTTLDALHLRPTCTPCPAHGFCETGKFVGCSIDYVPKRSPLRLGGLLPIAPKCVPDTEKLMVVAMQASKASRLLRKRRGEVVCGGLEKMRKKQVTSIRTGKPIGSGIGDSEAFVYGLQADNVLSALMRENEASKAPFSEEILEELNRLALNDLVNHGEVLTWQDGDDFWYASQTAEMPLSCQARLAAIRSVKKHKTGLAGIFSALLSILWLRYKLQARVEEKQRVAELVQTALVQLQRQERSHHTDPVLVPFPHIAPSHLRDLVLQHVHSPTRRAQLWKKVEKVVEGNSNVRVLEVEQNGEELRGWKWVGATTTPRGGGEGDHDPREMVMEATPSSPPAGNSRQNHEKPEMLQSGKRSVMNLIR